jgi:large subunit ribosomal protein L21
MPPPKPDEPYTDETLDPSVAQLLPLLRSQPPFFCKLKLHGKSYLVTAGDTVRLPFHMKGVEVGDVLRLNRAVVIGSRDYTLKAGTSTRDLEPRFLDERLYVCRARVVGVTTEPLRIKLKTKRRRRHIKRTLSKDIYTVLKITELAVHQPVDTLAG